MNALVSSILPTVRNDVLKGRHGGKRWTTNPYLRYRAESTSTGWTYEDV